MSTATQVQHRRGTTTQHASFTPALGEITVDTTTNSLVVGDGSTMGGHRQASQDYVNAQIAAIQTGAVQNQFNFFNTFYP